MKKKVNEEKNVPVKHFLWKCISTERPLPISGWHSGPKPFKSANLNMPPPKGQCTDLKRRDKPDPYIVLFFSDKGMQGAGWVWGCKESYFWKSINRTWTLALPLLTMQPWANPSPLRISVSPSITRGNLVIQQIVIEGPPCTELCAVIWGYRDLSHQGSVSRETAGTWTTTKCNAKGPSQRQRPVQVCGPENHSWELRLVM